MWAGHPPRGAGADGDAQRFLAFPVGTADAAGCLFENQRQRAHPMFTAFPLLLAAEKAESKDLMWFIEQMDTPGKIIVAILVLCSFIGWGAMITKWLDVSAQRKRNLGYEMRLRNVPTILSLEAVRSPNLCPYEYLTFEATQAYKKHRGRIRTPEEIALCMGHVENAIQRGIARNVQKYEEKMILLSSLVSGGPFLGLLGTVWGVMLTFGSLTNTASIATLAPGVSGALVATTFGLLVAIPATFGYNFLLTHTKVMTTELENFASSLADRIELELQDTARRARERGSRDEDYRESRYSDEGDALRPEPAYDAPRPSLQPQPQPQPRQSSFAATDDTLRRPPAIVRRPAVPTSSDFGPDSQGYESDAAPRRDFDEDMPPQRPDNRLRETRGWDDIR